METELEEVVRQCRVVASEAVPRDQYRIESHFFLENSAIAEHKIGTTKRTYHMSFVLL